MKKKDVEVFRGGSNMDVCDDALADDFIRKDIPYPDRRECTKEEYDQTSHEIAVAAWEENQQGERPQAQDYRMEVFDADKWEWEKRRFNQLKINKGRQLERKRGLVAGVTLNSLVTDDIIRNIDFDVVIVDEASKGYIYEILPALQKAGKQIIFIGDHKQIKNISLPNHIKNFIADSEDRDDGEPIDADADAINAFEAGPFAYMAEQTSLPKVMLKTNRRSYPAIVEAISKGAYDGRLKAGRYDHENPSNPGKLTWIDTSARPDGNEASAGSSKVNHVEARLLMYRLIDAYLEGNIDEENTGVISMYKAQIRNLLNKLEDGPIEMRPTRQALRECLEAGNLVSVDESQGDEWDTVYLATTRHNEDENIGFLDGSHALVGCSRARDELVIYGSKKLLVDENPDPESKQFFTAMYEACEKHGKVHGRPSRLPRQFMNEEDKSQTPNAKKMRKRRARKRQQAANA